MLLKQTLVKNADSRLGLVVHPECPASHLLDYNCKFFETNATQVARGNEHLVDLEFIEVITHDLCVPGMIFASSFRALNPGDVLKWADFSNVVLGDPKVTPTTRTTEPENV